VAGFISEWWPASNRYAWPECVGIRTTFVVGERDARSFLSKMSMIFRLVAAVVTYRIAAAARAMARSNARFIPGQAGTGKSFQILCPSV
jgi:hypothetical protein